MKSSGAAIPGAAPARRIAELFLQGAATFAADHVDLFDGVLIDLVPHSELAARADPAERLSLLANARRALVGQLARDALGRAASADGKATIGCHSGARVSANFDVQLHIGESRDSPTCNRTSEVRCFASPRNEGGEFPHIIRCDGTADTPHGGLRVRLCVRIASSCNRPMAGASRRPVRRSRRNRASVKDAQASTRSSLGYR
jgi:hypothetical protein